jgi:thiol-disulfide isomerase/thioredoxin
MKRKWLPALTIVFVSGLLMFYSCQKDSNETIYLRKVIRNIEQIKSAGYQSVMTFTLPGDTTRFTTYNWYKKEYLNPADTTIGSSFAWFYPDDTSRMYLYYDGTANAYFDFEQKTITIDSLKTNTLPFRPVSPPFFNEAKSIIKYALETKDTITTTLEDFGDSMRFVISVPDKLIHFFGKPYVMNNQFRSEEDVFSRYEVWINDSDDLPYRIIFRTPHQIGWETCKNAVLNTKMQEVLRPADYFPADFEIRIRGKRKVVYKDMTGKTAPEWNLSDFNNKSVALKELKYKVLLIEFTGIGCPPCHAALPFINQLVTENKNKDFGLVSIETWGNDIEALRTYHKNNELYYNILKASDKITSEYQVQGVPAFYLVDEDKVIRKVIFGYEKGETDKEIRDAIRKLL